jgi:hypothetical protein
MATEKKAKEGMTRLRKVSAFGGICAIIFLSGQAAAVELTGAWVVTADQCKKVFVRKGRGHQVGFREFSGTYGGGFIVEADRLRGKFANCVIKAKREDGDTINLLAGCTTDIMLSNIQFVLKRVDEDNLTRLFPGIEGMEVHYHRCQI